MVDLQNGLLHPPSATELTRRSYNQRLKEVVYEGVWEDVASKHAKAFMGHRVEIRVLDIPEGESKQTPIDAWAEFERRITEVTKGKTLPLGCLYSAEDIYESNE